MRKQGKNYKKVLFLLGIVVFIILTQHSSLWSPHHVPFDAIRSDDVD